MHRQPAVGMSREEQSLIESKLREMVFSGKTVTAKAMEHLVTEIIRRRTPPPSRNIPGESQPLEHVASSRVSEASYSCASSSRPSSRASTSVRSDAGSIARLSRGRPSSRASTSASRYDVIRDRRDRAALQQLADIAKLDPFSAPSKCDQVRHKAETDPWLKKALEERDAAVRAAIAARERQLREQQKLREELEQQVDSKKREEAERRAADREEHDARVRAAEQSLEEDRKRKLEVRRAKERERQAMSEAQTEFLSQRRQLARAEREEERADAGALMADHEMELKKEQQQRHARIVQLREMLVTEAERKAKEKREQELERLEAEYKLLQEMNAAVEAERAKQERRRIERVEAAKRAHEESRRIAEERAAREAREKDMADKKTIDGDRDFNDKERLESVARRQRSIQTQAFLREQMRQRALADALARDADAPYANMAAFEEADELARKAEEAEVRREAQRQWRLFLEMQQRAQHARKAIDEVPVSIARPRTSSPWV